MARHTVSVASSSSPAAPSQARARHPSLLQNQARQAGFKADLGPQARQRARMPTSTRRSSSVPICGRWATRISSGAPQRTSSCPAPCGCAAVQSAGELSVRKRARSRPRQRAHCFRGPSPRVFPAAPHPASGPPRVSRVPPGWAAPRAPPAPARRTAPPGPAPTTSGRPLSAGQGGSFRPNTSGVSPAAAR